MELCAECGVLLHEHNYGGSRPVCVSCADKIMNSPDEYGRVFKKLGDELAKAYENIFDADNIIRQECNEMA